MAERKKYEFYGTGRTLVAVGEGGESLNPLTVVEKLLASCSIARKPGIVELLGEYYRAERKGVSLPSSPEITDLVEIITAVELELEWMEGRTNRVDIILGRKKQK